MGRDAPLGCLDRSPGTRLQLLLVLIVMAVEAKKFPIAAIRRIVVMIVVTMMHRQFAQIGLSKGTGAATTNPWIDLERLIAIRFLTIFGRLACLRDDTVKFAVIRWFTVLHGVMARKKDCLLA